MAKSKVEIEQDPNEEVQPKVLATHIVQISDSLRKLLRSGLNRKAIIVLLKHSTGYPMHEVERVLDSLEQLATDYTR